MSRRNLSRRGLLAGLPALTTIPAICPDAELVSLAAKHCSLEDQIERMPSSRPNRDEAVTVLLKRQRALVRRAEERRAIRLPGLRAKAAMIRVHLADQMGELWEVNDPEARLT